MQDEAFRLRLALHLLPLSLCLRGVYFIVGFQVVQMFLTNSWRLFPFLAFLTAFLIEYQAINMLHKHKVVPVKDENDD